jgi:hypothetical protein
MRPTKSAAKKPIAKPAVVRAVTHSTSRTRHIDPGQPATAASSSPAPERKQCRTAGVVDAKAKPPSHSRLQVNDILTVILRFLCPWAQWRVAISGRCWMEALLDNLRNPEEGSVGLAKPKGQLQIPCPVLARRLTEISEAASLLYSQQRALHDSQLMRLCSSCGDLHSIQGNEYQILLRASPAWRRWYRPRTTFLRSSTTTSLLFLPCSHCWNDPRLCSREVGLKQLQKLRQLLENPASRFDRKEKFHSSMFGSRWSKTGLNGTLWEEGHCGFGQLGVDVNLDGWCTAPATHILLGYDFDGSRLAPHGQGAQSPQRLSVIAADNPPSDSPLGGVGFEGGVRR